MKEWLWDGAMDCGWENLSHLLVKTCNGFVENMLETTSFSPNEESKNLISSECMERFQSIIGILAGFIKDGEHYQYEDISNDSQNAIKLNSWILLGSLTETILQMFLAFYIDDYRNTKWQQWENFKVEQVQKPIVDFINNMVNEGNLEPKYAKSLREAIKDTIKEHTKEHPVQKIMLDELIQLFASLELFEEDELDCLKEIQSNRNGIHSFQSRTIGTWADLQYSVRFFCYLMEWVINHLPDIPDEAYYYAN